LLDTAGILFLASGAFDGITSQKIRNERPDRIQRALRSSDAIIPADLVTYGLLPELVARLQTLVRFDALSTEELEAIMTNRRVSPAEVWRNHFRTLGKTLAIEGRASRAIAEHAEMLGMGARGLQQVLFPLLADVAYDFETSERKRFVLKERDVMKGRRRQSG
jgi:ATP-dependent Clp protease ATP-binding subunit ClpX